jgi:hypothetical protein
MLVSLSHQLSDGYIFKFTTVDGEDPFSLQVWDLASDEFICDKQPGDLEFDPDAAPFGGGKIFIH